MLALAMIPITCWLCALNATPRKPRFDDEGAEFSTLASSAVSSGSGCLQ